MINKKHLKNIDKNREILLREENFAYFLPCEQLRSVISNFTISFPNKSIISDDYTVMPHGSVTFVLLNYATELRSFLYGPLTKPVKVGDIANKCDTLFIIEFQPAGFFPFSQINQKELTDKIVPFSMINHALDATMKDILRTALSVDELLLNMEKQLILSIQYQYPKELAQAIKSIIQREGVLTSIEISDNTFYCTRHINRLFNQYLGMSTKSFSRLVRINKSFKLLNEKSNTLDAICEKLGYYDVSHFVKDFKIVCSITPQEYRSNMSDFYSEIAKF